MFANFGPGHWAVLAIVMIVLFGAKKLPDAARSLGKSMRIFKAELGELQNEASSRILTPRRTWGNPSGSTSRLPVRARPRPRPTLGALNRLMKLDLRCPPGLLLRSSTRLFSCADSSAAACRSLQPPTEALPLGNRRAQGVNGSAPSA
jgi:sec-independent protein translocase protein TatA